VRDLQQLRAWQRAAPRERALVLEGVDGVRGVALRERRGAAWFGVAYSSPDVAALAMTSGFVRWRAASAPPDAPRGSRGPKPRKTGRKKRCSR